LNAKDSAMQDAKAAVMQFVLNTMDAEGLFKRQVTISCDFVMEYGHRQKAVLFCLQLSNIIYLVICIFTSA
jgi:hypothetical protein